jgi:replicative DNA helicase
MIELPLRDLETEQSVIASCIAYPDDRQEILTRLKSEFFYSERHTLIFEAIDQLAAAGLEPDLRSIAKQLLDSENLEKAGGGTYLSELLDNIPPSVNINHHIEILQNLALKRALVTVGNAIMKMGSDKNAGSGLECLDKAMQLLIDLASTGTIDRNISIADSILEVSEQIQQAFENGGKVRGIETGFYDLDDLINGLNRGSLYLIAARTSEGKSAFAGNIARNVAGRGHPVQIFSLEMTHADLSSRLLSAESKLKFSKLLRGDLDQNEWQCISNAACVFDDMPLYINDTAGLSDLDLMRLARKSKAQRGIELIIVDYLQLMRGQHPENKVQDISDISRTLKIIAKDLQIPVIALSQLNRNIEHRQDKTPQLSDLRDSGQLEQDADVIAFIHTVNGEKVVRISKNRQGPKGKVRVYFAEDFVQFQNGVD